MHTKRSVCYEQGYKQLAAFIAFAYHSDIKQISPNIFPVKTENIETFIIILFPANGALLYICHARNSQTAATCSACKT